MRLFVITLGCTALLFCGGASGDESTSAFVADVGENKLFIFPEPCQLGGWFVQWRKARWVYNGRTFDACWKLQRSTDSHLYVHTVDADGDAGSVPVELFKKAEPV